MLKFVNERRYKLKEKKSIILSKNKINNLLNDMMSDLNKSTVDSLKAIINFSSSIWGISHFIETFKGETINFANYYLFHRTVNFAKRYLSTKEDTYILQTIEKDDETILQIKYQEIIILKIRFTNSNIRFDLLKTEDLYEELLLFFAKEMSTNPSKKTQQRLQKVIKLGDKVESFNEFSENYIKNIGIDINHTSSWYEIKIRDVKDF